MTPKPTRKLILATSPESKPASSAPADDRGALVIIERPARDALTILIPKAWRYQTRDYLEFSKIEIHRYQS